MSRIRWGIAGALALIGCIAGLSAIKVYVQHGLALGVACVLVLLAIAVVGMASLALARRRIGRELDALSATPAGGALLAERRARLEAIAAAGARPDLRALADALAAQEAGRAYLGRYLVATTVLVGLVGTFVGLMETLAKVSPLLTEQTGSGALALLAAPLAGLHVTFGASLVAILVTLALSLAQGDLVLHEEAALTRLEDLTHHEIVPRLWPAAEQAPARTVALLEALGESLARALDASIGRLAERLLDTQEKRLGELERRFADGHTRLAGELAAGHGKLADTLAEQATKTGAALAALHTELGGNQARLATLLGAQAQEAGARLAALQTKLADDHATLVLTLEEQADKAAQHRRALDDASAAQHARLADLVAEHAQGGAARVAQLAEALDAHGAKLTGAAAERLLAAASEDERRMAALTDVTTRALEGAVAGVAGEVRALNAAVGEQLNRAIAAETEVVAQAATRFAGSLQEHAQALATSLRAELHATATATAEATRAAAVAGSAAVASTLDPLFATHARDLDAIKGALGALTERLTEVTAEVQALGVTLSAQVNGHAQVLQETSARVVEGLDRSVLKGGERLEGAASRLVEAAGAFAGATGQIDPRLARLTAELERLTHEIALMAGDRDPAHNSALVLTEMERIGDALERLTQLVRVARVPEGEPEETQEGHS